MSAQINTTKLNELAQQHDYKALRAELTDMFDIDVAAFIEELPDEEQLLVFRLLTKDQAMNVFAEFSPDVQQHIIKSITDKEISTLIEQLAVDDAVDMLEEMPATLVKRVLKNSSPETRNVINQFLKYPENSAGSIMTAEFTSLRKDITVSDALKRIRRVGEDSETIYNCYVTDDSRHLLGVVTVKRILLAKDNQIIQDLMEEDVISVSTVADREDVANLMDKYDLISLPVVDAENRLVGIVTIDDAVDVIQKEATEDFHKMSTISPNDKPYFKTGIFTMAKNRIFWLLILMISGIITGKILGVYEEAFSVVPLLVTFIPMLTDTGGNAGSQSSTLVIRGMAVGEINMKDLPAVIWKEFRVSFIVAVPLALLNYLRIVLFNPESGRVGLVVSLAMICTVLLANIVGCTLPMIAKLLKADPALMAAPLIATLVDALSLVIYFTIALTLIPALT